MIYCDVCDWRPATTGHRCDECRTSPVVCIGRAVEALGMAAAPGSDIFPEDEDHGPDWRDEAMRSLGFETSGRWER